MITLHEPVEVLRARFEAKFERGPPDSCWLWTASTNGLGYGRIILRTVSGKYRKVYAHRLAWYLANGPIPEGTGSHGTCVLHHCDNPSCVNPSHLYLGTQALNLRDMNKKSRNAHGDRHGGAKLSRTQVRAIRQLAKTQSQRPLAARFGVCQQQISNIVRRKSWASEQDVAGAK